MNNNYNKPKIRVVQLLGQNHLLEASQQSGVSVKMSGYEQGGKGSEGDGWE